jgi:hypothetical protein
MRYYQATIRRQEEMSFSLTPRLIAVQVGSYYRDNRFNGFFAVRRQTVKTVAGFESAQFHRDQSQWN